MRQLLLCVVAFSLALPSFALHGDEPLMAQCLHEGEDTTIDYASRPTEYHEQLKSEQDRLLTRMHHLLSEAGPKGTNYAAASRALNESQKHWAAYVAADCAVTNEGFGHGTAAGLAGESCMTEHYAARNMLLSRHMQVLTP